MKDREAELRGQGIAGGKAGKLARESVQGGNQPKQTKAQKRPRFVSVLLPLLMQLPVLLVIASPTWTLLQQVAIQAYGIDQTVDVDTSIAFMVPASGMRSTTQTNRHSSSHQGFMLVVPSHAGLSSQQCLSGRKIW